MTTVSVDPARMAVAIPAIEALGDVLDRADRTLAGVEVPAGPAVPADVTACVADARRALAGARAGLAGIPAELRRRVSAAQVTDAPWMIALDGVLKTGGWYAGSFGISMSRSGANGWALRTTLGGLRDGQRWGGSGPRGSVTAWRMSAAAARDGYGQPPRGVPSGLATGAKLAGKVFKFGGWGLTAYSNARNPYLSTTQKVTRTGASIATGAGVSVASGMAAGAMVGSAAGPAGFVIGAGAGLAWSIADKKLGVSKKLGDAAAAVVNATGKAAGATVNAVGDAAGATVNAAGDAAGVVADGAGAAVGAAGDAAGAVGGVAKGALNAIGL